MIIGARMRELVGDGILMNLSDTSADQARPTHGPLLTKYGPSATLDKTTLDSLRLANRTTESINHGLAKRLPIVNQTIEYKSTKLS